MDKRYLLVLVLALLPGLYLLLPGKLLQPGQAAQSSPAERRLSEANVKCNIKSDAAVANKVPIIEFQRLELESQREWLFYQCMQDQGYRENPAWQPAAESRTGEGEALKALRRAQMQLTSAQDGLPLFWLSPRP